MPTSVPITAATGGSGWPRIPSGTGGVPKGIL